MLTQRVVMHCGQTSCCNQNRQSFSARVAASLLKAIKMEELITTNDTEYEKVIQELIRDKDKIFSLKEKLKKNIKISPLFNTMKYTSNFEKAMTLIHKKKHEGKENAHVEIKDEQ